LMNMKTTNLTKETYLSLVKERLVNDGFRIKQNVKYDNQMFDCVTKHTTIEAVVFATTYFVFSSHSTPDINQLRYFSSKAFRYARKTSIIPSIGVLFAFRCIPVAIVDSISEETSKAVRLQDPPKHWAAPEKLAVFSLNDQKLHYWENTFPEEEGFVGADVDRSIIIEYLLP
jgi:hypothetical protein